MRRRAQRCVFRDIRLRDIAIHPRCTAIDDAFDLRLPRRFENIDCAANVDRLRVMWLFEDVFDVGEMHDRIDAAYVHLQMLEAQETAVIEFDVAAVRRHHHVEHAHGDVAVAKLVDDVRADETGTASNQDSHETSLLFFRLPARSTAARTNDSWQSIPRWGTRQRRA